jgi:plastocyanin
MPRTHYIVGILAAAALSACGGSGDNITQPNRPANSISIVDQAETQGRGAFNPNPLSVSLAGGGVVTWYNDDDRAAGGQYGGSNGTIHNIGADDPLLFSSGSLAPGRRFQHTFEAAGTFDYHCSIHPTMRGTITVTP